MSLQTIGLVAVSCGARNGTGAISVSGLKVGDRIISVVLITGGVPAHQNAGDFVEYMISTDDEVQQLDNSNLSGRTIEFICVRGGF